MKTEQYIFKIYKIGDFKNVNTKITLNSNEVLCDLARKVCRSKLGDYYEELTDETHMFGFTTNIKWGMRSKNPKFEYYEKHFEDDDTSEFVRLKSNVITIEKAFNYIGKKMLFQFDGMDFMIIRTKM